MKPPASIYQLETIELLPVYTPADDVHRKEPAPGLSRIAHIEYMNGPFERSFDLFPSSEEARQAVKLNRIIKNVENLGVETDKKFGMKYTVAEEFKGLLPEIQKYARFDVKTHCLQWTDVGETKTEIVEKIIPRTKAKTIYPKSHVQTGKAMYVPICRDKANIDVVFGCQSSFIEGPNASFDGEYFNDYVLDVGSICQECYADYTQKVFPKTFVKIDQKVLEEELTKGFFGGDKQFHKGPHKFLRLGKISEAGTHYSRDARFAIYESCIRTRTRPIFPTRTLRFDPEEAKLLRRSQTNLLYSIAFDNTCKGLVSYGFDNDFRITQMLEYKSNRVNPIFFLLIDPTVEPGRREKMIFKMAKEKDILVELIALRFKTNESCHAITGHTFKELKTINFQDKTLPPAWSNYKNLYMVANRLHPSYQAMIGNNNGKIRLCHHDNNLTYCGMCFTGPGVIQKTEHVRVKRFFWKRR